MWIFLSGLVALLRYGPDDDHAEAGYANSIFGETQVSDVLTPPRRFNCAPRGPERRFMTSKLGTRLTSTVDIAGGNRATAYVTG